MQKRLIRALKGEATPQVPFWFMRQAGRYLPEYRKVRAEAGGFMNLCFTPEMAAEVTLQPIRRFGMDAAILFSDILVVPYGLGQEVAFEAGEGPKLGACNVKNVNADFLKRLEKIYETVHRVRGELNDETALIGFVGAPWTVACYMLQGRGDGGHFTEAKKIALSDPEKMDRLMDVLVEATTLHLQAQIAAGAEVVQIFDSWAGLLPAEYFTRWAVEPTRRIVEKMSVPVIGFPRGAASADYVAATGVAALGLDQGASVAEMVGRGIVVQGNLDPEILLSGKNLEEEATRILKEAGKAPFIFNLGHGVIKETPPEHVQRLSDVVKAWRR